MGNEGPGVLGAWEDRPLRRFDVDVTQAELDARAAFVLTRIDGQTTIAELCEMTGFGESETLRLLHHLKSNELIEIEAVGPRPSSVEKMARVAEQPIRAVQTPTPTPERIKRQPTPARRRTEIPAGFGGPDPRQVAALRELGRIGNVPDVPFLQPGLKRYHGIRFDRAAMRVRCVLTLSQRQEVLFLKDHGEHLDHYEFFGIEPTPEKKVLKKAYFLFSRQFHPDSFFRKETGPFGEWIVELYKFGTDVHDALQSDEGLRLTYFQVIAARNAAFRKSLEAERAERKRVKDEEAARRAEIRRERTAQRKEALASRLENRKRTRRSRAKDPVQERLERAQRFYAEGMEQYQSGSFLAAANSLKLALSFDPKNEAYAKAYDRVHEKARTIKHDRLWQKGHFAESVGQRREAMTLYLEAVEEYPRPDHCAHLAEMLLVDGEDLHKAAELARKAADADSENVDYLILLGQIYGKVDLVRKGIAAYQKALEIDPKNDIAKKALRALKRK